MMQSGSWEKETLYFKKDEYFQAMLDAISKASRTIDFETYIFEDEGLGKKLVQALKDAAGRGVRVRVNVDGLGSFFCLTSLQELLKDSGVDLYIYHPFLVISALPLLNQRNHRKLCIVDERIAFGGSLNVTNEIHRETGVLVEGESVALLTEAFSWARKRRPLFKEMKESRNSLVRLNDGRQRRKIYFADLIMRIKSAKERVQVTNAYFVPPLRLLDALRRAAHQGGQVTLLLPERSDHIVMKWITETFYQTILTSGVKVFEYQKSFLHAKTLVIDDWAMVGSSNMNHRSIFHDLEVDVVMTHEASKNELQQQFEKDLKNSKQITLEELKKSWFLVGLIKGCLKIFSYWA